MASKVLNPEKKSFTSNSLFLLFGQYSNKFFVFVFFIIFARTLGEELVGQYSVAVTFISFITIFIVFGFDKIVERGIAQNNQNLILLVISACVGVFIFWIISIPILIVVPSQLDYSYNVTVAVQVLTLYMINSALIIIINASFRGLERMDFEASLTFISGFLFLILGSLSVYYFKNIISVAYAMAIERFITVIIATWILVKYIRKNFSNFSVNITLKVWFIFLKSSLPFVGVALISVLYQRVDILLLAAYLPDSDIGQYATAYRVFEILILIPGMIATAAFPIMTQSRNLNRSVYKEIAGKSIQYSLVVILPIIVGALFLAQPVIDFVFGVQFRLAGILLQLLVWGLLSQVLNNTLGRGIIAFHHEKSLIFVGITSLATNILINIILIPKIGVVGAVWATLGSYFISTLLHLILAKKFKLMPNWLMSIPPILGILLVCFILLILQPYSIILSFTIGGVLYLYLLYRFGIFKKDSFSREIISLSK